MAHDDIAVRMIEALDGASSLQLSQLRTLIEGMLADPRRLMAAKASLHLGQAVQFVDFRSGQIRQGKLIAKHDTQATVLEEAVRRLILATTPTSACPLPSSKVTLSPTLKPLWCVRGAGSGGGS